jgi:hypothetical protein
VQDVVAHLIGTNQFWTISIASGLNGTPTRFLATFDPVATPPQMIDPMRAMSSADVLARYVESTNELAAVVTGVDGDGWSTICEAPPGHVALTAVALHALWDAWTHERDIAIPLGITPVVLDDEVRACLLYAAGLGPAFLATYGSTRRGALTVAVRDPDVAFVVDVGPEVVVREGRADGPQLAGDAVAVLEGLTYRAPLAHELGPDDVWLLRGLGDVFDVAPASTGV